jgi:hypothetical protein
LHSLRPDEAFRYLGGALPAGFLLLAALEGAGMACATFFAPLATAWPVAAAPFLTAFPAAFAVSCTVGLALRTAPREA